MASKRKSQKVPPQPARGWRPWLFRLLAAVVLPGAALLVLEGGLRLAGSGYRTELLIPVAGREGVLTTNQRFGWRFFPRHLARGPVPLEIAASPPRETFRIFVVGGSAARGTPDSAYGFGRMLAVLLEASHGDRLDLEVVNAAMTAINSHVVLPIVADCARHAPDLFVVYLGNNEVVGPYGAGSVFRPLPPGLAAVRAGIALRSTRLGQLLDRGLAAAGGNPGPRRWQGMEMFLERRLAADDPRLEQVYRHFAANLEDTAEVASRAGARTLLATVAVNLADQPPFASLHRRALDGAAEKRWQARFDAGTAALAAGRPQQAIEHLGEAAEIDDGWAELHFHLGRAQAALGDLGSARASLARARDLDALRFRADSRINAVIRDVAARMADRGALFADVEAALSAASTGGLPGYELFHEHVHLTPAGNFAVATELWRVLTASDLLPPGAGGPLPSFEEVAERLALTDFDRYDLERDILGIVSRPPFTGQAGHGRDLARRRQTLAKLRGRLTAERWRDAEELYRRRLEADPDDLEIRRRFATGLAAHGTPADAAAEWRSLVDRLPDVPAWRSSLALALADAGDVDGAERQLEELLASWPETPETHVNLGTVDEKGGRFPQAIAHYRRALELAPDDDQLQPRHRAARERRSRGRRRALPRARRPAPGLRRRPSQPRPRPRRARRPRRRHRQLPAGDRRRPGVGQRPQQPRPGAGRGATLRRGRRRLSGGARRRARLRARPFQSRRPAARLRPRRHRRGPLPPGSALPARQRPGADQPGDRPAAARRPGRRRGRPRGSRRDRPRPRPGAAGRGSRPPARQPGRRLSPARSTPGL
jgi:tetratricopeptide (TPR) repeat protein